MGEGEWYIGDRIRRLTCPNIICFIDLALEPVEYIIIKILIPTNWKQNEIKEHNHVCIKLATQILKNYFKWL